MKKTDVIAFTQTFKVIDAVLTAYGYDLRNDHIIYGTHVEAQCLRKHWALVLCLIKIHVGMTCCTQSAMIAENTLVLSGHSPLKLCFSGSLGLMYFNWRNSRIAVLLRQFFSVRRSKVDTVFGPSKTLCLATFCRHSATVGPHLLET